VQWREGSLPDHGFGDVRFFVTAHAIRLCEPLVLARPLHN
jgi:hypothetical protein